MTEPHSVIHFHLYLAPPPVDEGAGLVDGVRPLLKGILAAQGGPFVQRYSARIGPEWSYHLKGTIPAGARAGIVTAIEEGSAGYIMPGSVSITDETEATP